MRLGRYGGETGGRYSIIENHKSGRVVNMGDPVDDFVVFRLKDKNTLSALLAYAEEAAKDDPELACDILKLAAGAGRNHPHCKEPERGLVLLLSATKSSIHVERLK